MHLTNYLKSIQDELNNQSGNLDNQDGQKAVEALMYAFGNMHEKCVWSKNEEISTIINTVLENFIHPQLDSTSPLLQARACWVYERYG